MIENINNALISKLKPTGKQFDIRDIKLKGFIIRVTANGAMSYVCQYTRGKRVNISKVGSITPAQAREKAKIIIGNASQGILPNTSRTENSITTFSDYILTTYQPWRISHRRNGSEDIARLKAHFFKLFGNKKITELQPLTLEKWRSQRINNGIHPETINRDINVLKASLSKAIEWNIICEHPFEKIKPLSFDRKPKVRYLNKEELQSLHKIFSSEKGNAITADKYKYLPTMIMLSLTTGARRGELFNLTWSLVDFDKRTIGLLGKSQSIRYVPLNDDAYNALNIWQQQSSNTSLVFTTESGAKLKTVRRPWLRLLKLAEIENFRWHDMRHHFASWLVMGGVDLNTVRELLGHTDIKMTLRYAHLAPEHNAKAVLKLPRITQ